MKKCYILTSYDTRGTDFKIRDVFQSRKSGLQGARDAMVGSEYQEQPLIPRDYQQGIRFRARDAGYGEITLTRHQVLE